MTGRFSCPSCMSTGHWSNLESYISEKKSKRRKAKPLNVRSELEQVKWYIKSTEDTTTLLKTLPLTSLLKIWEDFKLPFIPHSAIEQVPIRTGASNSNLYFPLDNVQSRTVGYRVLSRSTNGTIKPYIEPNAGCIGFWCGKSTKSKDTAILVPNIADFIVLLNYKIASYVVCLPNGLINLPQHILPSLKRFSKLILWFGSDLNSWYVARNCAKKLGEKRCLFVRPTDKQPLRYLAIGQDLKAIISTAQPIWPKSITTLKFA